MNLLTDLESRNTELASKIRQLKREQKVISRRASEFQFQIIGFQGEQEANLQIIKKLKENK